VLFQAKFQNVFLGQINPIFTMKSFLKTYCILLLSIVLFSGCSSDDDAEPTVSELLEKNWTVDIASSSITVDNAALSDLSEYAGLTLSLTATNYNSNNNGDVFLFPSGTWQLMNNEQDILLVEEDLLLDIQIIEANRLQVNFTTQERIESNGRSEFLPRRVFSLTFTN